MLVELVNIPRPYPWGDRESLASWQSRPTSEHPEAELWLGTHKGSEASVRHPTGREQSLTNFLREQELTPELPFLVKVLAASKPLSIQVHPTKDQARAGFAAEERAGVDFSSPRRNYKDTSDKPEVVIAWSQPFDALVGFQDRPGMESTVNALDGLMGTSSSTSALRDALSKGVDVAIEWLVTREYEAIKLAQAMTEAFSQRAGSLGPEPAWKTWASIIPHYPGDAGIVVASFLNYLSLDKGEALFVPAGTVHAYLKGFGMEVMAPSDNVIRGGLTNKHVDREQLAHLVVKDSYTSALVAPQQSEEGTEVFELADVPFSIHRVAGESVTSNLSSPGPMVIVVHQGTCEVLSDGRTDSIEAGRAYLWAPTRGSTLNVKVSGTLYAVAAS